MRPSTRLQRHLPHAAAVRSPQIYNLGINLSIGATIVHVALWHGRELYDAFVANLCASISRRCSIG